MSQSNQHRRAALAGGAYALAAFGLGFVLGVLRVTTVAPQFGELLAVVLEIPIMLGASWLFCRWLTAAFHVPPHWPLRLTMGSVALLVLLAAELILGRLVFEESWAEIRRGYLRAPGLLGLAAQVVFASFPMLEKG
jgi:branched-subunit amino acid ABC-type transport system permease component